MARSDPAVSLRVPSQARRDAVRRPEDEDRPRLRLVVTRGQLSVELQQPFALDPIELVELSVALPQVSFPVELSGGVSAFRNKRGELQSVGVGMSTAALQSWAERRLSGVLDGELLQHIVAPLEDGWLVGLCSEDTALAFEVVLAPLGGDLRLLPTAARGMGLSQPPQAAATAALAALTKPYGVVTGGAVIIENVPALLAKALFPLAGMRVPAARNLRWVEMRFEVADMSLRAAVEEAPAKLGTRALREIELATLVAKAEQALGSGELPVARRAYLDALARAPRHPQIARRLAELDRCVGGRGEAALSSLADSMAPMEAGILGAQLLAQVGDAASASTALRRAADAEPYGPLAAMCCLELAQASPEPAAAGAALDEAIARAPGLAAARWLRLERNVRAGRLRDARADLEHLEAAARSANERHLVVRRTADLLLTHRALDEAAQMFERALRYAPDGVDAVAGLGRALGARGYRKRALELFSRAVALAERKQLPAHRARLELARLLAEVADDRPAAIAHVLSVPAFVPATFEARLLEARWRAELGDLAGASEALSRLSDAVDLALGLLAAESGAEEPERSPFAPLWGGEANDSVTSPAAYASRDEARVAIAELLAEGARIHEIDRRDLPAARRLLAAAVRLAPRRSAIGRTFRRVAGLVDSALVSSATPATLDTSQSGTQGRAPFAASPSAIPPATPPPTEPPDAATPSLQADTRESTELAIPRIPQLDLDPASTTLDGSADELSGLDGLDDPDASLTVEAEMRAEALSERLRGDPNNEQIALELMALFEQLGRDHELLALISARIDESAADARAELVDRRRGVLTRLVARARADGRDDEAAIYELMLSRD